MKKKSFNSCFQIMTFYFFFLTVVLRSAAHPNWASWTIYPCPCIHPAGLAELGPILFLFLPAVCSWNLGILFPLQ